MADVHKLQYLYTSLGDLQATIRAIDTKVSFLLVILFLPLTKLGAIYDKLKDLLTHNDQWLSILSMILIIAFTIFWLVGFWCALRTIIAIHDPQQRIKGEQPKSMFYPAYLFKHTFWGILGTTRANSTEQFSDHYKNIPEDEKEIAKQLTFEQMKVMYIASVKIKRSIFSYNSTIIWIVLGGILWFLHLLFV